MEKAQTRIYQIIAKLLDGKSRTLNFETPIIPIPSIKARIQNLTCIPIHQQLLLSNGKTLFDDGVLYHGNSVHLLVRVRGGKGGFGSLLRGAATKAGQKKTNNFDACRDMSGRRLRHVNAEKKMEEWLADEKERKLEKAAEEFIKKKAKTVKKAGGDGADQYVDKYRKDSAKCMEEVDKSVRESLAAGFFTSKRKLAAASGSKSKKLKIWMGKRKVDDGDSDDIDEEDCDDELGEENEKSVVTNKQNQSDSNKEAGGSLSSVTGGKIEGESSVGCSSQSVSEEEKETIAEGSMQDTNDGRPDHEGVEASVFHAESITRNSIASEAPEIESVRLPEREKSAKPELCSLEERTYELPMASNMQEARIVDVKPKNSDSEVIIDEERAPTKGGCPDPEKPLNFDEFSSAAVLEVLGMERLKSELQERGLKCGGTLQERAARLFLLKTTPLEMLPKKLFAKK